MGFQNLPQGARTRAFGEQQFHRGRRGAKSLGRFRGTLQFGDAQAPRLLRGFRKDAPPALRALPGRREQASLAALRGKRHDFFRAELRGFFQRPLEAVELHNGEKQLDANRDLRRRKLFNQGELHFVPLHTFGARQPNVLAVAQLVDLPGFRAQHAAQMVRGLAAQCCRTRFEFFDKESPPHLQLCYIRRLPNRAQSGRALLCKVLCSLLAAILVLITGGRLAAQTPHPSPFRRAVIVDTDAAPDDLMAIAFLLSRSDVRIEAITIVNGVAHVPTGGKNVLRLLALAGHNDVPVFLGRESPLSGSEEFPEVWRQTADELPGVTLPETERSPESRSAADFLTKRLLDAAHPVEVLTLGPLTNLAEVFSHTPRAARTGRQLVVLGGAVRVSGNLGDGGIIQRKNDTSEWNMFIDPAAAKIVFSSGAQIRLVPLDATQRVPIDMALFEQFQSRAETPLAKFVAQILGTQRDLIRQGYYFAWDPLAAVALTNPLVATFRPLDIAMSDKPDESGRTVEVKRGRFNAQVAIDADSLRFRDVFMKAFGVE